MQSWNRKSWSSKAWKPWRALHLVLSLAPLLWTALMLGYACHFHASAGMWPRPVGGDNPPMDRVSRFLDNLTVALFYVGLPVFLGWSGLLAWLWQTHSTRLRVTVIAIFTVGLLAALDFIVSDPHHFFSWWID